MKPGDGNNSVYSPINVNVTLHCVVDASSRPFWTVDGEETIFTSTMTTLNARGIFIFEMIDMASDGISSNLTMYGNTNCNISICCALRNMEVQSCTTLIIYGKCNLNTTVMN